MIVLAHLVVYLLGLVILTAGGNLFCRLLFKTTGAAASREPADAPAGAGRLIGTLERLMILFGLAANSWEIMVAVVALKTVARYQELNKRMEAEYFLIGSLASILWAILVASALLYYDRVLGLGLSAVLFTFKSP